MFVLPSPDTRLFWPLSFDAGTSEVRVRSFHNALRKENRAGIQICSRNQRGHWRVEPGIKAPRRNTANKETKYLTISINCMRTVADLMIRSTVLTRANNSFTLEGGQHDLPEIKQLGSFWHDLQNSFGNHHTIEIRCLQFQGRCSVLASDRQLLGNRQLRCRRGYKPATFMSRFLFTPISRRRCVFQRYFQLLFTSLT